MTKPVAVFRSGVIEDSRHTVRLDENSHLVLFPSFSRYITSWAISATWPVEASRSRCYLPGSGIYMRGPCATRMSSCRTRCELNFFSEKIKRNPFKNTHTHTQKSQRQHIKGPPEARGHLFLGRIWWPEATRLEDPLDISNGTWTPKSSGERDGILSLV